VVLNGANRLTVVQLTSAGPIPGIWVSPGASATLAKPASLSSGDVAVFDGVTVQPASFETRPNGAVVEHPIASMADTLFARWRSELFVVAWIAVTLFTILVILRLRRMRGR
jgi:hypothetical protein